MDTGLRRHDGGIAPSAACGRLTGRIARRWQLVALPQAGFSRISPAEGAFYLYADVGDRSNDSRDFCRRMLAEASVAASPGVDFDRERGHSFVRFSYCGPVADMAEAARRLAQWR